MATYVIADVHGHFQELQALLKKIDFNQQDDLYLLGDVVDRGAESMAVLQWAMRQLNVYPLIGNHDYMALNMLRWLTPADSEAKIVSYSQLESDSAAFAHELEMNQAFREWQDVGGDTTLAGFKQLSTEQRLAILDYLGEFELSASLMVNQRRFVLVHAGLQNFSLNRPLSDYRLDELIFTKPDYTRTYFPTRYLVTGHTPTLTIHGENTIYAAHHHLAIDCGLSYGGRLAALCLETLEAAYV